jgi:hypothetical protein
MIKLLKYFLSNKFQEKISFKIDNIAVEICSQLIQDKNYFEFISSVGNGGFFFGQSLQLYSLITEEDFRSILNVNNVLNKEFDSLFEGLYSFGQDIFGNQFTFSINEGEIVFLNIETGGREVLAKGFKEWLDVLTADLEYYTGMSYEKEWKDKYSISLNERLQPKIPFVIGGDYTIDNFYVNGYPAYLLYNADISKQIINLKDGEKVNLKIKRNE